MTKEVDLGFNDIVLWGKIKATVFTFLENGDVAIRLPKKLGYRLKFVPKEELKLIKKNI